eukprot:10305778-Ditylum_brightwellii.AAC.1
MSIAPIIQQVLYYKAAQWCCLPEMTPPCIPSDSTGEVLRDAVDTQYDLGWNKFMKGQVAKQWSQAQAEYCRSLPRSKKLDSHKWTTTLIKAIWTILVDVWNARNEHLHTDMEHTTQSVLDKQVRKAYALKHSMVASDRLLFQLDMKDRLQSSPESKRLWLESIRITVHDFLVVHKHMP